jgi:3-hydroxybutyryl-CoA dehydrogenase
MKTIGVIGAGQMGAGITQVSAQAGYSVLLSDVDLERAQKGKDAVAKALNRMVEREKIDALARDEALSRIEPVAGTSAFAAADLVIEAATEREEIKRAIFTEVGKVLRDDAILASNTSSIPITRMAQASPDPARFIGIHFFNPVPVMGLIEVIPGLATSGPTIDAVSAYAESLKKEIVYAQDEPADFVGLDTCLDIIKVLYNTTGDSKYRPAPLLVKYVEAGWLGRKTGRGFYDYTGPVPVPTR